MLGCEGYKHSNDIKGPIANSQYISDSIINPHPRFGALTRNIRLRKEGNVDIRVPYDDDKILKMDAMAFGNTIIITIIIINTTNTNDDTKEWDAVVYK
jgi:hypothetical protein